MRINIFKLGTLLIAIVLLSFTSNSEFERCYISFTASTNLTQVEPVRLPVSARNNRTVKTENGEVMISRIDGYKILYNNYKKAPFLNLKVERSEKNSYDKDQKNLIENLKYLNSHTSGMETKDLIELEFNGYKVYGISRATIEDSRILGSFLMFPGNDITVYFDFQNIRPEFRDFEDVEGYKKHRNKFMNEYTKYLTTCIDK